jgi:hypothetical protein
MKTLLDCLCGHVEFVKTVDDDGEIMYIPDKEKYPPIIEEDDNEHIRQQILNYVPSKERKLVIKVYELHRGI